MAEDDFTCSLVGQSVVQWPSVSTSASSASGATWEGVYSALTANTYRLRVDSQPAHYPNVVVALQNTPGFHLAEDAAAIPDDWRTILPNTGARALSFKATHRYGSRDYSLISGCSRSCSYDFRVTAFPAGSLGRHVQEAVAAVTLGETPGASSQLLYSANNYSSAAPAAVRNTANMVGAYDYSGISVVNDVASKTHQGLLIGPRHIIGANHHFTVSPVVWMTADGVEFRSANIVSSERIAETDIRVGYLDTEIVGVTPLKFLPANYRDYLPTLRRDDFDYVDVQHPGGDTGFLPSDLAVRNSLPLITVATNLPWGGTGCAFLIGNFTSVLFQPMTDTWKADTETQWLEHYCYDALGYGAWVLEATPGDSGGGLFMPINGELVLVSAYFYPQRSPNYAHYLSNISQAMNNLAVAAGDPLAGSYAALTSNLSAFQI